MAYIRRVYCSKKHQVVFSVGALLFMLYYIIFHLDTSIRTSDLDFTRQTTGTLELVKAQINNTPADLKAQTKKYSLHTPPPYSKKNNHGKGTRTVTSDDVDINNRTENCGRRGYPQLKNSRRMIRRRQQLALLEAADDVEGSSYGPDIDDSLESIIMYIERTLQESLKEDKGTGCEIPKLDPFAPEIMQFDKKFPKIVCEGRDWVKCYFSKCKINPKLLEIVGEGIECTYKDIVYESDKVYYLGNPVTLKGNQEYLLNKSDHVKIYCKLVPNFINSFTTSSSWIGHGIGYRPLKPEKPPAGREDTLNVLIFGFDSTAKNGFIRKMPKSFKYITEELGAVVLNGYNIVGDGTPAALFPILTGKTELELPECRRTIRNSGHLDDMPFIFYKLKKDGYRTAYFEDSPHTGTFQYRFNGFRHQPADHYLRAFYLEELLNPGKGNTAGYCVGDTPRFQIMMNITDQFFKLDGKRFAFTFVADICHDNFNMIWNADEPFVEFLKGMDRDGHFKNTLLIVMGDHGPRYADVRGTLQGKMEERLPLMAIRLPEKLKSQRPEALKHLKNNVNTLTTAHDIHATILDVLDWREHWNNYKVTGADLTRGMTLLETIPLNRSCSEAGIEPHWCTCVQWEPVRPEQPVYQHAARALLDHINLITAKQRNKCAVRTLSSKDWVTKKRVNNKMLQFQRAKDNDGYVGKFGPAIKLEKDVYQVKITTNPGGGTYEAAVTHLVKENKFHVNTREISRINAYNKDPECISHVYPHLNMYCYCIT